MLSDFNSQFLIQIISTENVIRSNNLVRELNSMGLRFEISSGVVPKKTKFHEGSLHLKFKSKLICQRELSIGEVGCALAHRRAINSYLNSNYKFGVIFEDDAEIISNFDFDIIVKLLDSDLPVIIVLGWIPGFAIAKTPVDLFSDEPIELLTSPTCAFAYALNRSAAEIMTNNQEKIIDLADWPIYVLTKVKFYSINSKSPWATANHDPEYSIIGKRHGSISGSPKSVLMSRIKLVFSIVILLLFSLTRRLGASPKQVIHRVLIRDLLYKYGKRQSNEKATANNVIPFPFKFQKLLVRLKLV